MHYIFVLIMLGQFHGNIATTQEFLNEETCQLVAKEKQQQYKDEFFFTDCVKRPVRDY